MRILWHSNAPFAGTGYGNQTQIFSELLAAAGHEVIVSCFYGLQGASLTLGKIKLLPGSKDPYGNDMLLAHVQYYQPDIVIILCDAWVFDEMLLRSIKALCPVYFWAPIDHNTAPPAVLQRLAAVSGVWSMSKHGAAVMSEAGIKNTLITHGVNFDNFKPMNKIEARRIVGIQNNDTFVAAIVAANKGAPSRKAFDQQIRAFARFQKKHPDAILYLHTDLNGYSGENLTRLLTLADIPRSNVVVANQYQYLNGMFGADYINAVYNATDVLLNATRGEGFGIPIIEAQAAGLPVIVTDCTAMSEHITHEHCYKVNYSDMVYTLQEAYQYIPSVDGIYEALEQAYKNHKIIDRAAIRASVDRYNAQLVFDKFMNPAIEAAVNTPIREAAKNAQIITIDPPAVKPKLSVLMPAYNAKNSIDRAINSVLQNQDIDLELIVVDDCSNDGTWKHLRQYRRDKRVKTFRMKAGGGPVGALNEAIKHIQGDYVTKLDSDDYFEPHGLEILAKMLDDNPDIGFVYGGCQYHGKLNIKHEPKPYNENEFLKRNAAIGEPMYRATAHTEHKILNRGFWVNNGRWFGPHDWDLILQMIYTLKWRGLSTPQLIHHYNHDHDTASAKTKERGAAVMTAFKSQWPQVIASGI